LNLVGVIGVIAWELGRRDRTVVRSWYTPYLAKEDARGCNNDFSKALAPPPFSQLSCSAHTASIDHQWDHPLYAPTIGTYFPERGTITIATYLWE
jgi:hypothetical protein